MPSQINVKFDWKGDEVLKNVRKVAADAIDDTLEDARDHARTNHWWKRRTGNLEEAIVVKPAEKETLTRTTGLFGANRPRGFYGAILEHKHPFLVPAAHSTFHKLTDHIKARLKGRF